MTEQDRDQSQQEFQIRNLCYGRIEDCQLRVQLRVGELISTVAIAKGITFDDQSTEKGDEWAKCTPNRVMGVLKSRLDQHSITEILKGARRIAKASQVNGDSKAVAEEISSMIKEVGQPRIVLPEPIKSKSSKLDFS